ncbi:MAG: hypothetical protein WBF48_03190 [Halarcobacter sp.]
MKKQNKINRLNVRCTDEEWHFFQHLKAEGISISKFITASFKNTDRYKNFYSIFNDESSL